MEHPDDQAIPVAANAEQPAAPVASAYPPTTEAGRRHPPITDKARDTMAEQHLLGMPVSEIAALHGFEVKRISALFQGDDMKARVQEKRSYLLNAANKVMFKFLLHAEDLADAQVQCARNPGPDQYRARTWILERVAPARSSSHSTVDVNHHVQHEVLVGLRDSLNDTNVVLNGRPTESGIRLLDGRSAMPPADYDMSDDTQ